MIFFPNTVIRGVLNKRGGQNVKESNFGQEKQFTKIYMLPSPRNMANSVSARIWRKV